MAGTPYLVDSNVLLRWVKPNHRDYPVIVSAIDAILRRVAFYVTHRKTSLSSGMPALALRNATGMGSRRRTRIVLQSSSRKSFASCRMASAFTKSGDGSWLAMVFPACRFTMHDWWRPCTSTVCVTS
jgi:hypothetical protein